MPARTAVQGLAALAVVDLGRGLRENAIAMTSAAVATRHGAVSVASREVLTWAGHVTPGDVLGIVSGDVALIGDDLADSLSLPRVWYGPLFMAGVRLVLPLLELTRRSLPGMNGLATRSGHRLWSQCVEYAQC